MLAVLPHLCFGESNFVSCFHVIVVIFTRCSFSSLARLVNLSVVKVDPLLVRDAGYKEASEGLDSAFWSNLLQAVLSKL